MSSVPNPEPSAPVPGDSAYGRGQSSRAASIFGMVTAGLAALTIFATLLFAITEHPFRATITLGTGIAVLGIARAVWPGRTWFASRSRWWDVVAYVLTGLVVILLAPLVALGTA